jgi:hypothetical protein
MEEFTLTPPPLKDTRFTKFREWIEKAVMWKWQAAPRWGAMEGKQLSLLLGEMPDLTERDFCLALKNLLNSDDIPAMQRPGFWLPRLESYIVHPHDRFSRNPEAIHDTAQSQRQRRNLAAFEQVRKNHGLVENPTGNLPPKRIDPRRDLSLGTGLKRISDGSD